MTDDQTPDETMTDEVEDAPEIEVTEIDTEDVEETFPREYVTKLRDENARYRQKAGKADELARRVHRLLVERTGRLADPDDLPFDEAFLDDSDALTAAVDDLLERKPHLAARRPRGDVGQGMADTGGTTDLAAILRRAAN